VHVTDDHVYFSLFLFASIMCNFLAAGW